MRSFGQLWTRAAGQSKGRHHSPPLPVVLLEEAVLFPGQCASLVLSCSSGELLARAFALREGLVVVVPCEEGAGPLRSLRPGAVGTVARAGRPMSTEGGHQAVLLEGVERCRVRWTRRRAAGWEAWVELLGLPAADVQGMAEQLEELVDGLPPWAAAQSAFSSGAAVGPELTGLLLDFIAASLPLPLAEQQRLLWAVELPQRLALLRAALAHLPGPLSGGEVGGAVRC